LAPALDITLGADRRLSRLWRVAFGVAHVFPVWGSLVGGSGAPLRAGDTFFIWHLSWMPSAQIELAPVDWWSLALGARAGVGFGEANVVIDGGLGTQRREAGVWPVAHAFAQTFFAIPTRPSFGLGARAAAGWSSGPEILLEAVLVAAL
jgi:hypothetical protein